ncbi:MAG: hypothetical protein ABIT69_04230 [Sphingomicrobium sp.]
MRHFVIAATILIAGCTAADRAAIDAHDQQQLAVALAGRAVGPALKCLPQTVIDANDAIGNDLLFAAGRTTYVSHTGGGCGALSGVGKFLVLEHYGGSETCAGDIAKVADSSGFTAGSCVLGPFVPYRR